MPNIGPLELLIILAFMGIAALVVLLVVFLIRGGAGSDTPVVVAQSPAAGWHPDPEVPGRLRWWDGTTWTDQVSMPEGES